MKYVNPDEEMHSYIWDSTKFANFSVHAASKLFLLLFRTVIALLCHLYTVRIDRRSKVCKMHIFLICWIVINCELRHLTIRLTNVVAF